jgi:hypothetical protein
MRSLAANGNSRAEELIEKADELDKMIDVDPWDTEQVLGAWLRARKLWCEVTGEPRETTPGAPLSDASAASTARRR